MNPICTLENVEEGSSGDVVSDPLESFLLCISESWDKQRKQLTVGLVVSLIVGAQSWHLTFGTWATSLIICPYDLLLWLHYCSCESNFTLHVLNVNKDSRCVFLGCPAQHGRRVAGLFSRRSITLRVGEPRPQSQPCGDPGARWPLRGNTQTPPEHHQCQVVCFVANRGQHAPSYYTEACSWVHWWIEFIFHPAGSPFLCVELSGLSLDERISVGPPRPYVIMARCSPPQDQAASSRGLSALNTHRLTFPSGFPSSSFYKEHHN